MTKFELWTSGIGGDHSAHCATVFNTSTYLSRTFFLFLSQREATMNQTDTRATMKDDPEKESERDKIKNGYTISFNI